MSELKPCPKCGPNGAPLRRFGEMDEYRVECVECYTVKTPWFKTLKEAEAYWNAFAEGMKQQAARIAELKAECDRLRKALRGLMQAVDGCLTPHEALLWKNCEEALKGAGE